MSDAIRLGKRAFAWVTVVATITWSMGFAAFVAPLTAQAATDGDLIKGSLPSVYYYWAGKRYVFPNQSTFLSWYTNAQLQGEAKGGLVKTVTNAELAAISIGGNVTYRPGVKMVKITTDPKVYAVDKGGQLRWIASEAAAVATYGANWSKMVEDVPDAFFVNYKASATSGDIKAAADFSPAAATSMAASIASDMGASASAPAASGTPAAPTAAGSLSVALAPGNPAATTLITDAGNTAGGQRAGVFAVRLSAGSSSVQVDKLVLRRSGVASDADLDNMYLYDGGMLLAQVQSVSKGVATFTKSGGLTTVPANGYKDLWLKVDVNKSAAAGITIGWKLAAADVMSSASSVTGEAMGSNHTVTVVTDLAFLDVASVSPSQANTTDPQNGYDVWRFRLDANSQDMLVKSIRLTNVGSIDGDDLQNFQLFYAGTQLGATQPLLTNGTVTFDLSGMADGGYKITSGQQRQLALRADISGGTNRSFRFGVNESTDIMVEDLNYHVMTVPAQDDNAAFAVTQAGGATTINVGTLTQTIASSSPTGNVPDGATNVLFAQFNMKAAGEPVKVKTLDIACSGSDATNILKNVKLMFNGSQVGSTMSSLTCSGSSPSGTDYSFGNSLTIAAGAVGLIEIRGDLTDSTITSGETVTASLVAGSSNANGTISLTTLSTGAISGRSLTVKTGNLIVSTNASLTNYSSSRPLGVAGSANLRVGSFVVTGGAEPSDVSQIVVTDNVATASDNITLKDYFDNISLKHAGVMLHSSALSLTDTDATSYTFNISPSVKVGVGETYVVDVYADALSTTGAAISTLNADTSGAMLVDSVVATGTDTGSTTSDTTSDPQLQGLYIASNGSLRITLDADSPSDAQLVLGATDQTLAKFKLAEESNAEDILIKRFTVVDTMSINYIGNSTGSTGTLRNLKLYNGSTLLGTVAALDSSKNATSTSAYADFDLTGLAAGGFKVNKGTSMVLTFKSDFSPWTDGGISSSTHRAIMPTGDYDRASNGVQDFVDAVGLGSGASISTTDASAISGLVVGVATGSTQTQLNANVFDAVRTKLSIAYSDDSGKVSPSGLQTKNSEQTVAIFKVSNTANVGGYEATVKALNLDINSSGISLAGTRVLKIYKDSIDATNQLATTTFTIAAVDAAYSDTQFTDAQMTDFTVAAGGSRYIYVTLDTNDSSIGANDSLSVGIQTAAAGNTNPVLWSDSAAQTGTSAALLDFTEVNGMPLSGRSVSY